MHTEMIIMRTEPKYYHLAVPQLHVVDQVLAIHIYDSGQSTLSFSR